MSVAPANRETVLIGKFADAMAGLTHVVNGQDVMAFTDGVAWVPLERLDEWADLLDATGPHCCCIYEGVETVGVDERPADVVKMDTIMLGFYVVVSNENTQRASWEEAITARTDLVNRCRNVIEVTAAALYSTGDISETIDSDYFEWRDAVDEPDALAVEYIGGGYMFLVGNQIVRGTRDR